MPTVTGQLITRPGMSHASRQQNNPAAIKPSSHLNSYDPSAPRFVNPGTFPHGPSNRMNLAEVRGIGDIALLRYVLRSQ